MITKLLKNLFSKAETLSSEAEQNAEDYTDSAITEQTTYSTTEQAVGTWIDGKTVYRRVVSGTLSNTSPTTVLTDPSIALPNAIPIKAEGFIIYDVICHQIGCYLNSNNWSGVWWGENLQIYYGSILNGKPFRLILYYAK